MLDLMLHTKTEFCLELEKVALISGTDTDTNRSASLIAIIKLNTIYYPASTDGLTNAMSKHLGNIHFHSSTKQKSSAKVYRQLENVQGIKTGN